MSSLPSESVRLLKLCGLEEIEPADVGLDSTANDPSMVEPTDHWWQNLPLEVFMPDGDEITAVHSFPTADTAPHDHTLWVNEFGDTYCLCACDPHIEMWTSGDMVVYHNRHSDTQT